LILLLDETDGWKSSEKEHLKVGVAFIWEKENEEVNMELKLKGIEIPRLFSPESKIVFETSNHLNKIDKQFQYFDKVII